MEVPRLGKLVIVPGGGLHAREDDSVAGMLRLFLRPYIPVSILGFWIGAGLLKPGMLIGCVIDYQVDQDANATLLAAVGELDEVAERTIAGIDAVIVRYVVPIVAKWRRLKGHEPDGGHADALQVVEPVHETWKVSDSVAIRVHECRNRKAIDDRVLVPQ